MSQINGNCHTVTFCYDLDDALRYVEALLSALILTDFIEDTEHQKLMNYLNCIHDIVVRAQKILESFSIYLGHDTGD